MRAIVCIILAVISLPAHAQDNAGCNKFAWPVAKELAMFAGPDKTTVVAGEKLAALPLNAIVIKLVPATEAKFAMPPERKPRIANWFGGSVQFPALERAGIYQLTLSQDAWIDIVQEDRFARTIGSTGRGDCPGLRKSVRLELGNAPFVFQISGAAADTFMIAILALD